MILLTDVVGVTHLDPVNRLVYTHYDRDRNKRLRLMKIEIENALLQFIIRSDSVDVEE